MTQTLDLAPVGNCSIASLIDRRGRILMVMLNLAMSVARMDDMSGAGFVSLGGPGAGNGVGEFRNPCGIAVR